MTWDEIPIPIFSIFNMFYILPFPFHFHSYKLIPHPILIPSHLQISPYLLFPFPLPSLSFTSLLLPFSSPSISISLLFSTSHGFSWLYITFPIPSLPFRFGFSLPFRLSAFRVTLFRFHLFFRGFFSRFFFYRFSLSALALAFSFSRYVMLHSLVFSFFVFRLLFGFWS